MNILLTEDNALIASGRCRPAHAQGFRVMHAASAAEAEALLRTLQFDAWVLDLACWMKTV